MKTVGLLVEIWTNASDEKHRYSVIASGRRPGGAGTSIIGYDVVVLEEISHREVFTDKWLRRAHKSVGPRMEVTFDVIVRAGGADFDSALASAWQQTVEWMKPKVRPDSQIMALIRRGEAS